MRTILVHKNMDTLKEPAFTKHISPIDPMVIGITYFRIYLVQSSYVLHWPVMHLKFWAQKSNIYDYHTAV